MLPPASIGSWPAVSERTGKRWSGIGVPVPRKGFTLISDSRASADAA